MNEKLTDQTVDILTEEALSAFFDLKYEGKLSRETRREIAFAAGRAGYLVVPDITRESLDDSAALSTLVKVEPGDSLSELYQTEHLAIELGIAIAMSDGKVHPRETVQLSYVMERHFKFTDLEIRALRALKDFCLIYPPGIVQTARRLALILSPDERLVIAAMMTTVAAAAKRGKIGQDEAEGLLALFRTLEINESELDVIIKKLRIKRVWILLKRE
ncbi:MAG: TerB family tellurite resistance protein [Synergistaceae bacterium]|nr:TerB family tellurite resistance protein [Synergistaceae bacterium]